MKICKACGETKPTEQFHKDRSKLDGLNHYCKPCTVAKQREYQARPPRIADPPGLKRCQRCKQTKPTADFYANKKTFDGLQKRCKACSAEHHDTWRRNNLGKVAEDAKRRRAENPKRYQDYSLKQNYGLQPGDYERMLKAQHGRCAICETENTGRHGRFHVDHCHENGNVRGLLCHACNVSLGHFKHSEKILTSAILYLSKSRSVG